MLESLIAGFFKSLWSGINEIVTGWRRDRALTKAGSLSTANEVYERHLEFEERARHAKDRVRNDPRYADRVRRRFSDG